MTEEQGGALAPDPGRAPDPEPDEPPPILGSWPRAYAVVAAFLALVIALLSWFTKAFE